MAQLVKNPPAVQETLVPSLGWEDPLEKGSLPAPVFLGFTGGSAGKESAYKAGDLDSIPGLGRSPGGRHATHSSIFAWRTLMDRRTWWATAHGITESDMTKQLSTQHILSILHMLYNLTLSTTSLLGTVRLFRIDEELGI